MYLIDTNIFLEVIYEQENVDSCREFLNRVSLGDFRCIMTHFSIHAVESQVGENSELIEDFIRDIENSVGLEIIDTDLTDERKAAREMKNTGLSFDDQLHLHIAKKQDAKAIVTLDTDFDNVEIERLEPREIIS